MAMDRRRDYRGHVVLRHLLAGRLLGGAPDDRPLARAAGRLLSLRRCGGGVPTADRTMVAAPARVVPRRSELWHLSLAHVRGQALPRNPRPRASASTRHHARPDRAPRRRVVAFFRNTDPRLRSQISPRQRVAATACVGGRTLTAALASS